MFKPSSFILIVLTFLSVTFNVVGQYFTTNPSQTSGLITICKGQTVTFTNVSINPNNDQLTWDFINMSEPNTSNDQPFNVVFDSEGLFEATLYLGSPSNKYFVKINVLSSSGPNPNLELYNDATYMNSSDISSGEINGIKVFKRCNNNSVGGTFVLKDNQTHPSGTIQTLDWGEGAPQSFNTSSTSSPIFSHTFTSSGSYNLTYTVTYPGGCSSVVKSRVFMGQAASINIASNPTIKSCAPFKGTFLIEGNNVDDSETIYTVKYNDGTPDQIYTSFSDIPKPIEHIFTKSSCGAISGGRYPNSFEILAEAMGTCSEISSTAGSSRYYVSSPLFSIPGYDHANVLS